MGELVNFSGFSSFVFGTYPWRKFLLNEQQSSNAKGDSLTRTCLILDEKGWLKWTNAIKKPIFLVGLSRLDAVFQKVHFESANWDGLNGAEIERIKNLQLYPVAFILRFRIKKVEERVKFFVKSEQTLKRWIEVMAKNLHKKYGFQIDHFDFQGDTVQFINFWDDFKRKNYVSEDNNLDVDLKSCCGVTDLTWDAAVNQFDNPVDYDLSKQEKPEEESSKATDEDARDEEMDDHTMVQALQLGII